MFVLALCLIMPVAFMLSACDDDKPAPAQEQHVHSWNNEWSKDATNHWHDCDGCEETKDVAAHNFVFSSHKTPATCTVAGVDIEVCSVCGQTREVSVNATGIHTPDEHGFCSQCGEYQGEMIAVNTQKSFSTIDPGTYYFKFAIETTKEYRRSAYGFLSTELHFFGKRDGEWQPIVMSVNFEAIADTDDHYVYLVATPAQQANNAWIKVFSQCAHGQIDNYGFCTDCDEYVGVEIDLDDVNNGTPVAMPETQGDEIIFVRVPIDNSKHYSLLTNNTNWDQSIDDEKYYVKNGNSYTEITGFLGLVRDNASRTAKGYYFCPSEWPHTDNYLYAVLTVNGETYVDTADTLTVSTAHVVNTATGYCYAGEYTGTEIEIGEEVTLSLTVGQKAYYRFADPGDYQLKRVLTAPLQSSDIVIYYTDSNGAFHDAEFTNTYADHTASFDGYYYVVITAGATFENGKFVVLDDVIPAIGRGAVPSSTYYMGDTYSSTGKEYEDAGYVDNLGASQIKYLRFEIEKETEYSFTIEGAELASNADVDIWYYDNTGAHEITTNWGSITLSDGTDGYLYVHVNNNSGSAVSGGFELTKVN